ncbi:FAD binding domain-containing protein [Pseudomassariella vexata]|uniref:FAD binding domain-containing protein n=1 Tax=Pseudomassariella vexata TaxID=1141098 RepID=A0A1Y2E4P1_9PEZI|nr:FAD binding domain-containing protein [Pseudomassariella vexata]ORY66533.1 FAD binding domain-containing protein [Pseudomassariella vexata]
MARSLAWSTWQRGFAEPSQELEPGWADETYFESESGQHAHYSVSDPGEKPTSTVANEFGLTSLRSWPGLYNGTQGGQALPSWWKPSSEVDVLICGGGPFGLAVALNLARQGVSFRIVDKAEGPCHSGRADSVQPRALEYLHAWGLGDEVSEEGPIINELIMHRDGVKLVHSYNLQSDSRYRGNHVATQGQIEKIYVRDLLRHKVLVERQTTVSGFEVADDADAVTHPVTAKVTSLQTGKEEVVKAKYLVGADGAASKVREFLGMPFDGLATDCFFTIMDCEVKTDYPYILDFSMVISTEHGGVIIVPREQGVTRVYVQVTGEKAAQVAEARRRKRENHSTVGETQVYDHGITPEEAKEQLNKIMAPWKIDFAGPMSWFAVWRVNERVARSFSTPNQRVHIGGDAAHVHSVLGAFGLNSSIYDAANLSWKLGLAARGFASPSKILPTYDAERRIFANHVIRFSGAWLRFLSQLDLPLAALRGMGDDLEVHDQEMPPLGTMSPDDARGWLRRFFGKIPRFNQGLGIPSVDTVLSPAISEEEMKKRKGRRVVSLINGARAPNVRVCFDAAKTAYLYDAMMGVGKFHVLIFTSDLQGHVRERLGLLSTQGFAKGGFFNKFGGKEMFNVVLVTKALPHDADDLLRDEEMKSLAEVSTVVYDDRAPDEDAHYVYGVNHARGGVVVVRPDLIVGMSTWPENTGAVDKYLSSFLIASA